MTTSKVSRTLLLLAVITLVLSFHVYAQTFDAQGGLITNASGQAVQTCTNSGSYMKPVLVGGRWWLCTTSGHLFFFEGIGCFVYPGSTSCNAPGIGTKYASATIAAQNTLAEFEGWNFNAVGQKTFGCMDLQTTCSGVAHLPEIQSLEWLLRTTYSNTDCGTATNQPVKNMSWSLKPSGDPWFFKPDVDVFDQTNMQAYFHACFANAVTSGFAPYKNSGQFVALMINDADGLIGVGCGPDFDCGGSNYNGGHNDSDGARIVMSTSPMQTFEASVTQGNVGGSPNNLYSDLIVYSKDPMASPPTTCAIATPCSLATYLTKKYGTIAALNTAWSTSSFYTTFGSSGKCWGYNLSWCGSTGATVTICASVTWDGIVATCTDTTSLTALNISPKSVQVIVDGVVQAGDCPWFEGNNNQGSNINNCGSPGVNKGFLRGLGSNTIASTSNIAYTTGAITINFKAAPSAGAHTITVSYIQNGWAEAGTGILDEDGSHSWMGTNQVCLLPVNGGGAGTDSWACRKTICNGGNGAVTNNPGGWGCPDMNATAAADLEAWLQQQQAQFNSEIKSQLNADAPGVLYMSEDQYGSWGAPPNKNVLFGACGNVDILFLQFGWSPDEPANWFPFRSESDMQTAYTYSTQSPCNNTPIMVDMFTDANADSPQSGNAPSTPLAFTTQGNRGTGYYNILNSLLNNGGNQILGLSWWEVYPIDNPLTSEGLKTLKDNAFDGHEAVTSVVSCSPPLAAFNCGGEAANYGNSIDGNASNGVKNANLLWISAAPVQGGGGGGATAPAPAMMVRK